MKAIAQYISRRITQGAWLMMCSAWLVSSCLAQRNGDLRLVNADTQVEGVSYRGNESFAKDKLNEVVATQAPTNWDRLIPAWTNNFLFRETKTFNFNPFEVQKDLIRLRHFYNRNGFLHPNIVYNANLNTTQNRIYILFNIREGDPLLIQEVAFYGADQREVFYALPPSLRPEWRKFRDGFRVQAGERFSETELAKFRDQSLQWLQNQGFAFAKVQVETLTDSVNNFIDVNFDVQTGKQGYFDEIEIEGLEKISRETVLDMLTFKKGDPFSYKALAESKKRIFESSQFRVALYDLPKQPEDSTVNVRFRLREAKLRTVSAETGLDIDVGLKLKAAWEHRNFFGGARGLNFTIEAQPGSRLLTRYARNTFYPEERYALSATFRQPHILTRNLSLSLTPFFDWENNQLVSNEAKTGLKSSLFYQFGQFQNITLQSKFQRVRSNGEITVSTDRDNYNQATFLLSSTLGKIDNILLRSQGYILKPFIELSGRPFKILSDASLLDSGTNYLKLGAEGTYYSKPEWFKDKKVPFFLAQMQLNGRLFAGQLWSADDLNSDVRTRYNSTLFFAGGDRDVRGWQAKTLGPKRIIPADSSHATPYYKFLGGNAKLAGNLEAQFPIEDFPGLRLLSFFDFGYLDETLRFNPTKWQYGTGAGMRLVLGGFMIGADLGYKLNPNFDDTHKANGDRCRTLQLLGCGRMSLHLQVGQTF